MIPEELISKYLDGELSELEDRELRQALTANSEARIAFDSAVLIHIAMRCESPVAVPEGSEAFIFDAVEAMAAEHVATPAFPDVSPHEYAGRADRQTLQPRRSSTLRRSTALAMLLLIGMYLPVSDGSFFRGMMEGQILANNALTLIDTGYSMPAVTVDEARVVTRNIATTISEQGSPKIASITCDTNMLNPEPNDGKPTNQGIPETVNSLGMGLQAGKAQGSNSIVANTPIKLGIGYAPVKRDEDLKLPSTASEPAFIRSPMDVVVFSSYGQSMMDMKSGTSIANVSAGVGYCVAPSIVVGVELGSMSYTSMISTTALRGGGGSSVASHAVKPGGGTISKLTPTGGAALPGETERVSSLANSQSFWGTAFMQYRVVNMGALGINGRVGLGTLNSGMLGYGRLQADVKLLSAASLFVGAEARTAPFRRGAVGGVAVDGTYETLFLVTYGLQVRF